jgi:hypothetical protein
MTFGPLHNKRRRRNKPIPERARGTTMEKKSYVISESGVKVFLDYRDNISKEGLGVTSSDVIRVSSQRS